MTKINDQFGREVDIEEADGSTIVRCDGVELRLPGRPDATAILARVEAMRPTVPAVPVETSWRMERADAYYERLKVEPGDDRITVIGDTLDKVIAQLATLTIEARGTFTTEFAEMLGKLQAVKAEIPKRSLSGARE